METVDGRDLSGSELVHCSVLRFYADYVIISPYAVKTAQFQKFDRVFDIVSLCSNLILFLAACFSLPHNYLSMERATLVLHV